MLHHIPALAAGISAFWRTRALARKWHSRADIEAYQAKRIAAMLRGTVRQRGHYQDLPFTTLSDLPIIDKQSLLADFAGFNRAGISADDVRAMLASGDDRIKGYAVGQSTGTSGNRGYYVVSNAERFVWLGTILAKALPDALWRRHKVALALPGQPTLYKSANSGSRIQLGFFDLALGVDAWVDDLVRFAPDTIVAPPKVLRRLAEAGQLGATHIFSGAEVLDPLDRQVIEAATGARVREIYMATEGLFGVGCPHGTLHLAEDAVHFEWEKVSPDSPLVSPIFTDFTRRVQVMARYRMNDLLELADAPCPCGSPLQAVKRIEGRQDDVFMLHTQAGAMRMVTPDVVRNAVIDADRRITDFRIVQTGPSMIAVTLADTMPPDADGAVQAMLAARLAPMGLAHTGVTMTRGIGVDYTRKLRRVRRDWHPPATA